MGEWLDVWMRGWIGEWVGGVRVDGWVSSM